jgi:hypothetical protein
MIRPLEDQTTGRKGDGHPRLGLRRISLFDPLLQTVRRRGCDRFLQRRELSLLGLSKTFIGFELFMQGRLPGHLLRGQARHYKLV